MTFYIVLFILCSNIETSMKLKGLDSLLGAHFLSLFPLLSLVGNALGQSLWCVTCGAHQNTSRKQSFVTNDDNIQGEPHLTGKFWEMKASSNWSYFHTNIFFCEFLAEYQLGQLPMHGRLLPYKNEPLPLHLPDSLIYQIRAN